MATWKTLREGELFSIIWSEEDLSRNLGLRSVKTLGIAQLTPECAFKISVYWQGTLRTDINSPGTMHAVLNVLISENVAKPIGAESTVLKCESIIVNVTKDGVRQQMLQNRRYKEDDDDGNSLPWKTIWDHKIGEGGLLELLIDFGPAISAKSNNTSKMKTVSQQLVEKMFSDRTLADVTFTFPSNF